MPTTLEPELGTKIGEFAREYFQRLTEDFSASLPHPIAFIEAGMVEAGWDQLVAHFAPMSACVEGLGQSLGDDKFVFYLDQRMSYLLPGTLLMLPDPELVELVKSGDYSDELREATEEIANCLVAALKRSIEPMGYGEDLIAAEPRWEEKLLQDVSADDVHLRGLFRYRGISLLALLKVPAPLVAQFAE